MPTALDHKSYFETNLCGHNLVSPIMNASGAFNPVLFNQLFSLKNTLGAVVTKTVTEDPRPGNIQQRTVELPGIGMLNSIGLQNPGLDYTLDVESKTLADLETPLILSISAYSKAGFISMLEKIIAHPDADRFAMLELNLSCPNVEKGGVEIGSSVALVKEAVETVTAIYKKPVLAKLTPNVTDIIPLAEAALEGGASGFTAINTVLGASIDIRSKKAILPRVSGGYSGPGIKPIALHHVWRLHHRFPQVPIVAVGGIQSAEDILEFLMAGATAVQVGTACFRHPLVFTDILETLHAYKASLGVDRLSDLRGIAHRS